MFFFFILIKSAQNLRCLHYSLTSFFNNINSFLKFLILYKYFFSSLFEFSFFNKNIFILICFFTKFKFNMLFLGFYTDLFCGIYIPLLYILLGSIFLFNILSNRFQFSFYLIFKKKSLYLNMKYFLFIYYLSLLLLAIFF